jgi:hypothetical protein
MHQVHQQPTAVHFIAAIDAVFPRVTNKSLQEAGTIAETSELTRPTNSSVCDLHKTRTKSTPAHSLQINVLYGTKTARAY